MLTVSCTISRDQVDGGLPPLDLDDEDAGYEVLGISPGDRAWEHEWARSPVVGGALPVSRRRALMTAVVLVRVSGGSAAEYAERRDALLAATDQGRYTLRPTIDGQQEVWVCHAATAAPADGELKGTDLVLHRQTYRLSIPRQPT